MLAVVVKRAGAKRVQNIYNSGVRPQAFYGAEVNGASDLELAAFRRVSMRLVSPGARTASLTAKLIMLGDPAGAVPFACVLRWAQIYGILFFAKGQSKLTANGLQRTK